MFPPDPNTRYQGRSAVVRQSLADLNARAAASRQETLAAALARMLREHDAPAEDPKHP
jgi:hypothetical protein